MKKLAPWIVAVAAACSTGGDEVVYQDQGTLCVFDHRPETVGFWGMQAEPQSYAADQRVFVGVDANECLSSSCDIITQQTCAVVLDGDTLRVSSTLAYEKTGDSACTDDCGSLAVVCESEPLPEGTYTLVLGATTRQLTIPSTVSSPCG